MAQAREMKLQRDYSNNIFGGFNPPQSARNYQSNRDDFSDTSSVTSY
jgi:hypothetical protein